MHNLLVNAPTGLQEIIQVADGGSYFDESLVVWDERKDGPLPDDVTVGGMARVKGKLKFNADVAARTAQKIAERSQANERKPVTIDSLIALLVAKGIVKEGEL